MRGCVFQEGPCPADNGCMTESSGAMSAPTTSWVCIPDLAAAAQTLRRNQARLSREMLRHTSDAVFEIVALAETDERAAA